MKEKKYLEIVSHYESCLDKHGDTNLGVDWPKPEDVDKRYRVMLELIKHDVPGKITLLDFGCGASHLYDYMLRTRIANIDYSGLDLSQRFIDLCKQKFPDINYYCVDVLDEDTHIPNFDYIIMNGVFTEKQRLSSDEMLDYCKKVIEKVFEKAEKGIAFNVMSKQVDFEKEYLFHLSFDVLAVFLTENISRNFIIRHDYGLYEYTTYVYK